MNNIEEKVRKLLDNYSENKKIIDEGKKNINIKLTILALSLVSVSMLSPLLFMYELPIFLTAASIAFITPQLITFKMQGSYYKNIKKIINSRKDMDNYLNQYKELENKKIVKENKELKQSELEIDKHNLRQKELEMVFSDENYYPYIERIKSKTLKR